MAPALERAARDLAAPQVLVIVPDGSAAVALARALAPLDAADGLRIVAATTASRAKRLLGTGGAQVVIGAPFALAPALQASVLKLDQVAAVVFAAADELDAEDADLAAVVTEVPKGATRTLTALEASEGVETLLERYMHKARRVTEDVTAAVDGDASNIRWLAVAGSPIDAVPQILDDVDPPTVAVVAAEPVTAEAARVMLRAIGQSDETTARVTDGDVAANTALVVVLGVPTGTVWAQVLAAKPAQVVAVIAPRQRASLQRLAGAATVLPFVARSAVLKARAAEARVRAELRDLLVSGVPSREVLALEPLLGEFDGLEIAAAALKLLDRARTEKDEAVRAAEGKARAEAKAAQAAERDEPSRDRGEREERAPRSFAPRGDRGDRGDRGPRSFTPRGHRGERGPRAPRGDDFPLREPGERPRSFAPRGDKPRGFGPRAGGDKPRGFGARGDKPGFGARGDKPSFGARGDKPAFGPRGGKPGFGGRDDKPRGPRRDDDRGPRGPRGPR